MATGRGRFDLQQIIETLDNVSCGDGSSAGDLTLEDWKGIVDVILNPAMPWPLDHICTCGENLLFKCLSRMSDRQRLENNTLITSEVNAILGAQLTQVCQPILLGQIPDAWRPVIELQKEVYEVGLELIPDSAVNHPKNTLAAKNWGEIYDIP